MGACSKQCKGKMLGNVGMKTRLRSRQRDGNCDKSEKQGEPTKQEEEQGLSEIPRIKGGMK